MEPSFCSCLTQSSKTIGRLIILWRTLKCPASGLAPLLISAPSRAALSKASFSLSTAIGLEYLRQTFLDHFEIQETVHLLLRAIILPHTFPDWGVG